MRGYDNFHALPYYIVSMFIAAYIIEKYIVNLYPNILEFKSFKISFIGILSLLLTLCSLNNYLPNAGTNLFRSKDIAAQYYYDSYTQLLTNKGDPVWYTNLFPQSYLYNDRKPASRIYLLVPWFVDAYSDVIISDLQQSKPKLIIYESDNQVWGHKYNDFAAKIFSYIKENYTILNPIDDVEKNIFIRNDYYNEATRKLWSNLPNVKEGMLISNASTSEVFLIQNGERRYIPNPDIFQEYGFDWNEIIKMKGEDLIRIKKGKPLAAKSK